MNRDTRILIVEDDYFVGLQNEDMLTKAGFSVVGIATSADDALALVAENNRIWSSWIFDLLITATGSIRRSSFCGNMDFVVFL